MSGTLRAPQKFAATLSEDPAIREIQQYLLNQNQGLLTNTILSATDWRLIQVNASAAQTASTFALQYRTPPASWATVCYFDSSGNLSTAAAGGTVPSGGSTNQVLTKSAASFGWADGSKATLTTTGDLLYASAPNTLARLAAGAATYVLTANGAGVAPSWQVASGNVSTIYEVDFTTQTTQNFQTGGDGTYVINGVNWKVTGTGASVTTFAITNGTGIVLAHNNIGGAALEMRASLASMASTSAPTLRFTEVWYRATVANLTANYQSYNCGLVGYTNSITNWLCRAIRVWDASGSAWLPDYYFGGAQLAAGSRVRTTTNLTDDVTVLRILSAATVEVYTGVWSSGWPDVSALRRRGILQLYVPSTNTTNDPDVNDYAAYLGAYGTINGASMTVTNMRVRQ